jgi:hypothetical protein
MTKDEALKMALQVLEEYTSVVTSVNDPNTWIKVADGGKPAREAIDAIKNMLAQSNPLTDEEIEALAKKHNGIFYDCDIQFARAIESKLKDKNVL